MNSARGIAARRWWWVFVAALLSSLVAGFLLLGAAASAIIAVLVGLFAAAVFWLDRRVRVERARVSALERRLGEAQHRIESESRKAAQLAVRLDAASARLDESELVAGVLADRLDKLNARSKESTENGRSTAPTRRPIRLYWWRHPSGILENFGDELGRHLVALISGRPVEWAPVESCDLVAVGSVLEHVLRDRAGSAPAIWGAGFISPDEVPRSRELVPSAVRGRLSAARVSGAPALGDPALLARHVVGAPDRRSGVGLVPHYRDLLLPIVRSFPCEVSGGRVISPLQDPRDVLAQIAACDVVLSSSLHGLIVADSLGIPNRWIELSDSVLGEGFKFRDYFSCFADSAPAPVRVRGIEDVHRALREARSAERPPGVDDLADGLVEAFPNL